jgi:hypothetical protein
MYESTLRTVEITRGSKLFVTSRATRPFSVLLSDQPPGLIIRIKPMAHERLDNQAGVAQVTGAILLKLRPQSRMEPVCPLFGLRLADAF